MDWYYSDDGKQAGPVADEALMDLVPLRQNPSGHNRVALRASGLDSIRADRWRRRSFSRGSAAYEFGRGSS